MSEKISLDSSECDNMLCTNVPIILSSTNWHIGTLAN